eukprot:COSAG05_NODE_303_length_11737_cov_116.354270_11_plen_127_part_00
MSYQLYESTAISQQEAQADVTQAMAQFRATNLKTLKSVELKRKEGLRIQAENKKRLAEARLKVLKEERSKETLVTVMRDYFNQFTAERIAQSDMQSDEALVHGCELDWRLDSRCHLDEPLEQQQSV